MSLGAHVGAQCRWGKRLLQLTTHCQHVLVAGRVVQHWALGLDCVPERYQRSVLHRDGHGHTCLARHLLGSNTDT